MSTTANTERLDSITKRHTAFSTFQELLDAKGGYFPSIRTKSAPGCWLASGGRVTAAQHRAVLTELADAYDAAQEARGDKRRAYRS